MTSKTDGISTLRKDDGMRVPIQIEKILGAVAMSALCLITLGNVFVRYTTNYSFAFTEEYSIALMVVVAMLGTSTAVAYNRHIRITWFVGFLPARWRRWIEIVVTLATVVMFGLLLVLGGRLVWDEYRFEVTSPGLGYPQWIYTLMLPLLSIAVIGRAFGYLMRTIRMRAAPEEEASGPDVPH